VRKRKVVVCGVCEASVEVNDLKRHVAWCTRVADAKRRRKATKAALLALAVLVACVLPWCAPS